MSFFLEKPHQTQQKNHNTKFNSYETFPSILYPQPFV